jgi:hypothetical protein
LTRTRQTRKFVLRDTIWRARRDLRYRQILVTIEKMEETYLKRWLDARNKRVEGLA